MPASAIIISTLTKPPREGDRAAGNAAASAKKGAGVDDARTLRSAARKPFDVTAIRIE
jgi:hypothetical protein